MSSKSANSQEIYKQKLWEFYSVTGIPVSIIADIDKFEMLYPQAPMPPKMNYHSRDLKRIMVRANLPVQTPYIRHLHLSCFYCVMYLDADTIVQIGPVASHDIDFKKYLSLMQQTYPLDIVAHHMKIIQGAPKVDMNYFINAVILATHFLCDKSISKEDIYFDKDLKGGNVTYSESFIERTSISVDQLSFEDEIYHIVRDGNIKRLEELHSNRSLSSFYYFQENDLHFLRIAFIFYGAITCHYAALGGLSGKTIKQLFRNYISNLSMLSKPQDYWKLLPEFASTLCHKVHDNNTPKTDSEIVNKCTNYIENNSFNKISISDLEKCSNASRKTILRHFKTYLNTTPSEFIANHKLKEVAYALEESSLDVLEISIMFGYSSQSHLNRLFIKKYGCTPVQYRRAHQK